MLIPSWNHSYDTEKEEIVFKDGTRIPAPRVKWDTPEGKAMLDWANKYIDILEWKKK